jgi:undecaprenyl pyrophosphate synthase
MPPVDPRSVPLTAYGSWPGIDTPGRVRMNRTQLTTLARRLEAHLEEMLSADEDLQNAQVKPEAYGNWDAARALYPSIQTGHTALADQHSRVLHAVLDLIKNLHRSARIYDDSESDLERRIAEVDRRLNVGNLGDTVPNSLNPQGG